MGLGIWSASLGIALTAIGWADDRAKRASLPPGRPYVLKITGDNTITFVPQVGLNPLTIDYRAEVGYLVNARAIEPGQVKSVPSPARAKSGGRGSRPAGKSGEADGKEERSSVVGAVDLALHATEWTVRHDGKMFVEARMSRARFRERLRPQAPVISVAYNEAPPALHELLNIFDTTAASILIDDRARVVRRRIRHEAPMHALVETLLSIHTPIPRDVGAWEAPTRLAMGHGQTASGMLRFEKVKPAGPERSGVVQVKVSGVLKAQGAVVGNLIKDGTYTVSGEQSYDPRAREWVSARWSVAIRTELANRGGTVAHGQGKMLVEVHPFLDRPSSPAAQ